MKIRKVAAASAAAALALITTGCSTAESSSVRKTDAGKVAIAYTNALFTEDFAAASRLVDPADRDTITLFRISLGKTTLSAKKLNVGSVYLDGSSAEVVLTGDLCSTQPNETEPSCLRNANPRSNNPRFRVTLSEQSAGKWLVSYTRTSTATSTPSSSH